MDDDTAAFEHDEQEMMWETAARKAVEEAVADARFDEKEAAIILPLGYGHNGDRKWVGIQSLEDLDRELTELAESEWINYAPFDGGEPVFEPHVDGYWRPVRHHVLFHKGRGQVQRRAEVPTGLGRFQPAWRDAPRLPKVLNALGCTADTLLVRAESWPREFLEGSDHSWVVLECGSPNRALAIAYTTFEPWLKLLNETEGVHRHINLIEQDNRLELRLPNSVELMDLTHFLI